MSETIVWRPSEGSGAPATYPALSRAAMIAPIDCGRIASARASALPVVGPSRSSRKQNRRLGGSQIADVGLLAQASAKGPDHDAKLRGQRGGLGAFGIGQS